MAQHGTKFGEVSASSQETDGRRCERPQRQSLSAGSARRQRARLGHRHAVAICDRGRAMPAGTQGGVVSSHTHMVLMRCCRSRTHRFACREVRLWRLTSIRVIMAVSAVNVAVCAANEVNIGTAQAGDPAGAPPAAAIATFSPLSAGD